MCYSNGFLVAMGCLVKACNFMIVIGLRHYYKSYRIHLNKSCKAIKVIKIC